MNILVSIRSTFRAARYPLSLARGQRSAPVGSTPQPRSFTTRRRLASRAVMGAGGSKEGEGGGGGKKKSTKKSKETAVVATPAPQAAPVGKESGGGATDAQYVECTVGKVSEFGENE